MLLGQRQLLPAPERCDDHFKRLCYVLDKSYKRGSQSIEEDHTLDEGVSYRHGDFSSLSQPNLQASEMSEGGEGLGLLLLIASSS